MREVLLEESIPHSMSRRAPGPMALLGTALVVGVAAGFLELGVLVAQIDGLHRVGWGSLQVSRHVAWMVPVAETLIAVSLTFVLMMPVWIWEARRSRGRKGTYAASWAWGWSGTVLGTLLFLGPLLAIRGIHSPAALVLASGAGFRIRGWLVRPTPGWRRVSYWAGGMALGMLPSYALVQWSWFRQAPESAWSRPAVNAPNLLWIVMDTVRADRMSLYGYGRRTTPELERWAREGITFDTARSAAPWTLPSHLTMFTGLWPFEHGGRIDRPYLGPSPTLAEHLGAKGYATAGIVANVRMCNATYGVSRGFDSYVDYPCNQAVGLKEIMSNSSMGTRVMDLGRNLGLPVPEPSSLEVRRLAPEIVSEARTWLDRVRRRNEGGTPESQRPFFLFLNFMDVHGPYLPSPAIDREFWTGPVPPRELATPKNGWDAELARISAPPDCVVQRQEELEAVTRRLGDLYDDCLRGLDAELGRFLIELRDAGILEKTWVVITSDHGEHLGEHGQFGHGGSLYNESTHVPLILIPPLGPKERSDGLAGVRPGLRIGVPVSHRDLPRTFSELLVPDADNPFPGHSLARHWEAGKPESVDPVLSQLEKQHIEGEDVRSAQVLTMDSIIEDDHVLIESSFKGPELYHLSDRDQRRDLAVESAERSRRERLKRAMDDLRRPRSLP